MVNKKPNTTGMDWSLLRLRDIFALLLHKAGIDNPEKNMQAAIQCASWTDRSLEVATCATVVEDLKGPHIGSLPSQQTSWLPVVVTETEPELVRLPESSKRNAQQVSAPS